MDWHSEVMALADPDRAAFNSKITPGKGNIVGARIPDLRALARRIVGDDWESFLQYEPRNFEEEMLRGIVIATAPMPLERRMSLTEGFLAYVDNWATCDVFCSSWKFPRGSEDEVWDFFSGLMSTGTEYGMRVSVVARMSLFKDRRHMERLAEDLVRNDNPGYYYRMGAAWALSVVYVRFPDIATGVLESGELEPWTHDRTIQKICESRRVTDEDRRRVRGLRRRAP